MEEYLATKPPTSSPMILKAKAENEKEKEKEQSQLFF